MSILDRDQVFETLEASACPNRQGRTIGVPANARRRDILNTKRSLLHFLENLEGGMSVAELRDCLEDYE